MSIRFIMAIKDPTGWLVSFIIERLKDVIKIVLGIEFP